MDNHFGGVVWTNHALERLRTRGVKQGDAWATWSHPEQSRKGSAPGSWVYYRTYGNEKIEVVAKQNEKKEWIILSVWSDPVSLNVLNVPNKPKSSFWANLSRLILGR